jgi:YbbR domain-containing protein
MMARLGQNLGMKLLSLVCSFALFLYVHKQQAGEVRVQVPLSILLDPTTRVVNGTLLPRTVSVTLSGPAARLQKLEHEARASVDLRGRGSGVFRVPVEVHFEPDATADPHEAVDAVWQPSSLSGQLEEQIARRLSVQTAFNVQPPSGYSLGPVRLTPGSAVVSGWESDVRRVKRLQAAVSTLGSGTLPALDLVVPVRPVDAMGLEVNEGIQVQPPTIKVQATLVQSIWSKPVYVVPTLGDAPPTVRLRRISVTPRRLTLRGPENLIGPVQFLETEPIPFPEAGDVLDREVRVLLPPGLKTEERPAVRVVISMQGGKP